MIVFRRIRSHQVITRVEHHEGIPLAAKQNGGKTLIRIQQGAPIVQVRPLAAYESLAGGGAR